MVSVDVFIKSGQLGTHGRCSAYMEIDHKLPTSGHFLCLSGWEPGQSLGKPRYGKQVCGPARGVGRLSSKGEVVLGEETRL